MMKYRQYKTQLQETLAVSDMFIARSVDLTLSFRADKDRVLLVLKDRSILPVPPVQDRV